MAPSKHNSLVSYAIKMIEVLLTVILMEKKIRIPKIIYKNTLEKNYWGPETIA